MQKAATYISHDLAVLLERWSTVSEEKDTGEQVTFHIAHVATTDSPDAPAAPGGRS